MLIFEVHSGQLSKGTRVDSDIEWFKKDTDRLIIGKYRQLDSGGRAVLANPEALTGDPPYPDMKVLPYVVVGAATPARQSPAVMSRTSRPKVVYSLKKRASARSVL